MNKDELKKAITFDYYSILAANPTWKKSLAQYLRERLKVGRDLKKNAKKK